MDGGKGQKVEEEEDDRERGTPYEVDVSKTVVKVNKINKRETKPFGDGPSRRQGSGDAP